MQRLFFRERISKVTDLVMACLDLRVLSGQHVVHSAASRLLQGILVCGLDVVLAAFGSCKSFLHTIEFSVRCTDQ